LPINSCGDYFVDGITGKLWYEQSKLRLISRKVAFLSMDKLRKNINMNFFLLIKM
jgi:hypothetical protein